MKPTQVIARDIQLELNEQLNNQGVSLVTCGHCGDVLLTPNDVETAFCPHCGSGGELCDFPDLFHDGMEWVDRR